MSIETIDLRPFTRSEHVETNIFLVEPTLEKKLWIQCGEINLHSTLDGVWDLKVRAGRNATDEEESSAIICCLSIIGLRLEMIYNGISFLDGFIKPYSRSIYDQGVLLWQTDPFANAATCTECEEPHPIIPFIPKHDPKLNAKVSGLRVEIRTGLKPQQDH